MDEKVIGVGEKPRPDEQTQRVALDLAETLGDYEIATRDVDEIRNLYLMILELVRQLQSRYPPLFQLPGRGQKHWRKLEEAVKVFAGSESDFYAVLNKADKLAVWLVKQYNLSDYIKVEERLRFIDGETISIDGRHIRTTELVVKVLRYLKTVGRTTFEDVARALQDMDKQSSITKEMQEFAREHPNVLRIARGFGVKLLIR